MTWVRIDEGFPEHPKVLAVGDDAAWLFVCALAYCNRNLTDGLVHETIVGRLTGHKRPGDLVKRLVDVGMLEPCDGGWQIHDYDQYQHSRAKVMEDRGKARERMARNRGSSPERESDVRPNDEKTSPYPSPSRVRPENKSSSVGSSNGTAHRTDDDEFMKTINILVEHKAREHPPRSRRAWERTTIPKTIEEDGPQVRTHLEAHCDPVTAAGLILGSQAAAELAAGRL